ncbi:MAG TPA: hypothetical protein VH208_01545, partial [Myxococcaceae bacterium]|nr:hypothetical protein [Myxococcaceae bacterium]
MHRAVGAAEHPEARVQLTGFDLEQPLSDEERGHPGPELRRRGIQLQGDLHLEVGGVPVEPDDQRVHLAHPRTQRAFEERPAVLRRHRAALAQPHATPVDARCGPGGDRASHHHPCRSA